MVERSHVTRRVATSIDRDFPARPTLPGTTRCDGLAFLLDAAAATPDLRPIREQVGALWRGRLSPDADAPAILLVQLLRPTRWAGASWPAALPLVASAPGILTSFARDPVTQSERTRRSSGELRHVELWWGGKAYRLAVAALDPVPIVSLWDMPAITVHRPVAPPELRKTGVDVAEISLPQSDLAPVRHARAPVSSDGADLMGAMNADLRDFDARTRLAAIFRQALGGLFRVRTLGEGTEPGRAPQPGILANLAGWLRWHSPFGTALQRRFGERTTLVEKLIASGDIDGALRLALKLGSGNPLIKKRNRFPNQLPAARARLDFDLSGGEFSAPIMADGSFHALRGRYLQLANQLEKDGDFRRSAYIHSQLLSDHHRAVLVLENGKLFREAAKLALDSKQPATLAIRLLFQAGERDGALALARRTACFDQLAEDSRGKDAVFHAYVVKAWTDMLIATGQLLRAVQVTDQIAGLADVDDPLLSARRGWLSAALQVEDGDGFGVELAARALLTATWTIDDVSAEGIEAFPGMTAIDGAGRYPALLGWLQALLRNEIADAPTILPTLLAQLTRLGEPKRAEQARFWEVPSQPIMETLARELIASPGLDVTDLQPLQALLARARLDVLATDIGKLGKFVAGGTPLPREWHMPAAETIRPIVRQACLLGNGTLLIWRESNVLQLLDRHGAPLWQQSLSDVVALVAVGTSPHVIVIQAQRDGTRLLARFASHSRSFHPIGRVNLVAHHDMTSESQWLVQIDGEIGALDLVKLCAPMPMIEFLWSCRLTDRLRAIAFAHFPKVPSWLTYDMSEERRGVLEIWSLRQTGELTAYVCKPVQLPALPAFMPPGGWCWFMRDATHRMCTVAPEPRWMQVWPWSEEQESDARAYAAGRARAGMAGVDLIQPCDYARPYVGLELLPAGDDGDGVVQTRIMTPDANVAQMTLVHAASDAVTCLARGNAVLDGRGKAASATSTTLFADGHGRLFMVDSAACRVTII